MPLDYEFTVAMTYERRLKTDELQEKAYDELRQFVLVDAKQRGGEVTFKALNLLQGAPFTGALGDRLAMLDYYQVFYTFTLLHAVKDISVKRQGVAIDSKTYPGEKLRTELAKQLAAGKGGDLPTLTVRLATLETRLRKKSLNSSYHSTYAYCNLSLLIHELQMLAGDIILREVELFPNESDRKTKVAAVDTAAQALSATQATIAAHLAASQVTGGDNAGGWRHLWRTGQADASVSILAEFALSEVLRHHFLALGSGASNILPNFQIATAQPATKYAPIQEAVNRARDYIWAAGLSGKATATPSEILSLAAVRYEFGKEMRPTLIGGFYSTFAGAYVAVDLSDARVVAARDALDTGTPFAVFEQRLTNAPDAMRTYYNQMFFGRALARLWFARPNADAAKRKRLEVNIRDLVQRNLSFGTQAKTANAKDGLIDPAQYPGVPVAEAMRAYFFSLCYPVLEDLRVRDTPGR